MTLDQHISRLEAIGFFIIYVIYLVAIFGGRCVSAHRGVARAGRTTARAL